MAERPAFPHLVELPLDLDADPTLVSFQLNRLAAVRLTMRRAIEAIPEADWTAIPHWLDGGADVAETSYTPFADRVGATPLRLIVRRVRPTPSSQLDLFGVSYSYHAFVTDRDGDTLVLEADHRRHAEIENAIRDLKYGVGLNHLPSGKFGVNAAWLALQVMAHNLGRWVSQLGLGERLVTTKTLRRRLFSLAGRITRSARRLTLHFLGHDHADLDEDARMRCIGSIMRWTGAGLAVRPRRACRLDGGRPG